MREKAQTGLRWALALFGALVLLVLLFNFLFVPAAPAGRSPGAVQLLVLRLAGVGTGTFFLVVLLLGFLLGLGLGLYLKRNAPRRA